MRWRQFHLTHFRYSWSFISWGFLKFLIHMLWRSRSRIETHVLRVSHLVNADSAMKSATPFLDKVWRSRLLSYASSASRAFFTASRWFSWIWWEEVVSIVLCISAPLVQTEHYGICGDTFVSLFRDWSNLFSSVLASFMCSVHRLLMSPDTCCRGESCRDFRLEIFCNL